MSALNSWQRIDRVLPGFPFGNGADGAYSSATIPTLTKDSCSGTSSSTTLTTAGSTFANGDVLLIHQTRGTGVGQWEINRVSSGGGTASLTLQTALHYTYTDSGASQAQATKIPMYTNVTVQSGTWTTSTWDQNKGGILTFASNGSVTVTGTVTANAKGFRGGSNTEIDPKPNQSQAGEGTGGDVVAQTGANSSGGGGGYNNGNNGVDYGSGAGGGHASAGTDATVCSGAGTSGTGGSSVGSADLTTMVFGGGGGSKSDFQASGPNGGNSGGAIIIFAKNIASVNAITNNGGNGATQSGGGSGGSILLVCQNATLGSAVITASGGTGGSSGGGAGSDGRIAVHHSGAVTGTTSPSFTDVTDGTLIESSAGLLMNLL